MSKSSDMALLWVVVGVLFGALGATLVILWLAAFGWGHWGDDQ